MTKPRYPIPRYPTGWFQVGYGDEFPVNEAKPLKYFGKDLVAYRSESGKVSVLDAFCPHLGAHLGFGGKVKGEEIECPFHAWRFDGTTGSCTAVPYAKRIPAKAAVKPWHVVERNTAVFVWHDIDGGAPTWDVPEILGLNGGDFSEPVRKYWRLSTHNQEMAENVVDSAHFKYVHGTDQQPASKIEANGHVLHMVSPALVNGIPAQVESTTYGFGVSHVEFTGLAHTVLTGNVIPVDDEFVDVRFTFTVKKVGDQDITKGIGRAFVKEITRQLEQDKPIWEAKIYHERPTLCDGDGEISLFRRWSKQFYPEWYHRQAWEAFYGAPMPTATAAE
jgi:3-ketosteroid 9alpha-monooxygenase subunit A